MAKQVQIRRGNISDQTGFIGVAGEITYNTDTKKIISHDGTKAGGYPAIHENGDNGLNLTLTGNCIIQGTGFQLNDSNGTTRLTINNSANNITDINNTDRFSANASFTRLRDQNNIIRLSFSATQSFLTDINSSNRVLIDNNNTKLFHSGAITRFESTKDQTNICDQSGVAILKVASGNCIAGTPNLLSTSPVGFLYIPTITGIPTSTPTTINGYVPICFNTGNSRLYIRSGSSWISSTFA